ncbi:MAG: glycosyltransferase family 2 protein, partial [Lachnospiraceae bacterium]|nr:glycosyltransferase family 2 protein [Lachnospiraceae bacterium]
MRERYKKKKSRMEDVLLKPKEDRRKLSNVPDKTNTRSNIDRRNITEIDRNTDMEAFIKSAKSGI